MADFITVKDSGKNEIAVIKAIDSSFSEIEERLGVKVTEIQRSKKIYGSNSNVFFVDTISSDNTRTTYLLKFGRNKNVEDELKGDLCIQGLLNIPKIVLHSKRKNDGNEWILYEYVPGRLMSEEQIMIKNKNGFEDFYKLEEKKELYLYRLHSKTVSSIDYSSYINSRGNKLFRNRLLGDTYKEFYESKINNISSLFNRIVILNGKRLPLTINQIIKNISDKYNVDHPNKVMGIIGHGDAHHGNILVDKDIWFIDNEYADITTPFMELAKPYYNDFLGSLFFHQHKSLKRHFKITTFKDTGVEINIKATVAKPLNEYLEVTKIKLRTRKDTVNEKTEDFLSLNDYLFLCHTLTKNPNKYPEAVQKLFILFAILLSTFNPLDPESILNYF